jgi:hypothetical protein
MVLLLVAGVSAATALLLLFEPALGSADDELTLPVGGIVPVADFIG